MVSGSSEFNKRGSAKVQLLQLKQSGEWMECVFLTTEGAPSCNRALRGEQCEYN